MCVGAKPKANNRQVTMTSPHFMCACVCLLARVVQVSVRAKVTVRPRGCSGTTRQGCGAAGTKTLSWQQWPEVISPTVIPCLRA